MTVTGQEILWRFLNIQDSIIDVSPLASGCYIIQTTSNNGEVKTVKLLKK